MRHVISLLAHVLVLVSAACAIETEHGPGSDPVHVDPTGVYDVEVVVEGRPAAFDSAPDGAGTPEPASYAPLCYCETEACRAAYIEEYFDCQPVCDTASDTPGCAISLVIVCEDGLRHVGLVCGSPAEATERRGRGASAWLGPVRRAAPSA